MSHMQAIELQAARRRIEELEAVLKVITAKLIGQERANETLLEINGQLASSNREFRRKYEPETMGDAQ